MEAAIRIEDLGKMYKMYANKNEKVVDLLHLNRLRFWRPQVDYTEFWALRNLELEVPRGRRLGIIGRNGAGKSTLLKIIIGNISPTEGRIRVNGEIQALMQLGAGFHPEFTGRENIYAALSYSGITKAKAKRFEEDIIDFSELEDFIDQPIKTYSSGMYSRLAFAVSTVIKPDILVIDEVLGAGDAAFVTKCAERMRALTEENGTTVLFVSHSMESVLEICETAILLERGRITASGAALDISKIYNKKVREEDELYLRAKEYKMKKRDARALALAGETQRVFLFRLCTNAPHPKFAHKIYGARLCGEGTLAEADVGAAMDNDFNSATRVIDGKGVMDWGNSQKDARGYYRAYRDAGGSASHAPFQLAAPLHLADSASRLLITADVSEGEPVYADWWNGESYLRLGVLRPGYGENEFALTAEKEEEAARAALPKTQKPEEAPAPQSPMPQTGASPAQSESPKPAPAYLGGETPPPPAAEASRAAPPDEAAKENEAPALTRLSELQKENSVYGTAEAWLDNIDLVDESGRSSRLFTAAESMTFRMDVRAKAFIPEFTFVISILTSTGRPVAQVFCPSSKLGLDNFSGGAPIEATYAPLRIGEGEYMASIGIFKSYDLSTPAENASYCVVDRALFFKIRQPAAMQKGLGVCLHACRFTGPGGSYTYDPAIAHGPNGDGPNLKSPAERRKRNKEL